MQSQEYRHYLAARKANKERRERKKKRERIERIRDPSSLTDVLAPEMLHTAGASDESRGERQNHLLEGLDEILPTPPSRARLH